MYSEEIVERLRKIFADFVVIDPSGCHLWQRAKCRGYGQIRINWKAEYAHRIAWFLAYGSMPSDKVVLHLCDTPACVNVEHLRLGTQQDNIQDCVSKRRHGWTYGSTKPTAKLTEEIVRDLRRKYVQLKKPFGLIAAWAREYGMQHAAMRKAVLGLSWRHIEMPEE